MVRQNRKYVHPDFGVKRIEIGKGRRTGKNMGKDTREVYMLTNINPPPGEGNFCDDSSHPVKPHVVERINCHMAYVDSSDRIASSSYSMCRLTFKCKAASPRAVFSSAARHTLVQMDVFPLQFQQRCQTHIGSNGRISAAISAALPDTHWFKWTYFHERALPFPQRCCQGHGAANAASRESQRVFVPRCWARGIVTNRADSTSRSTTHCCSGKLLYFRLVHNF
jgi:hypothetical protein